MGSERRRTKDEDRTARRAPDAQPPTSNTQHPLRSLHHSFPMRRALTLWLLLGSVLIAVPRPASPAQGSAALGRLRFRITLAPNLAPQGTSGRLFVLMSDSHRKQARLETG